MMKKKLKILFPLLLCISLVISGCNSNSNTATDQQVDIISSLVTFKNSDYYTNWQGEDFTYINLEGATATIDGNGGAVVEDKQILIRTSGTYIIKGTLDDGQIVVDAEDSGNVRLVLNGTSINSSTSAPIYVRQADKTIISLEENTENTISDASEYVNESESNDDPSAAIYSKDDVTINGSGSLIINGNYNDGIKSNDDLKITGGTIHVTSVDDGIIGKDLLAIKDATINVTAGGDGLKASNDEDKSKGNIALENGNFTIKADGDGIQAENIVAVANGKYTITTGGGSPETIETREGAMSGGGPKDIGQKDISSILNRMLDGINISDELKKQLEAAQNMEEIQTILQNNPDILKQIQDNDTGRRLGMSQNDGGLGNGTTDGANTENNQEETPPAPPTNSNQLNEQAPPQPPNEAPNEMPDSEENVNAESNSKTTQMTVEDSVSTKGIKAGTSLYVNGGKIKIDSLDDAIHSNQDVTISGGTINISTGDDGIHGDANVLLNGGKVSIHKSLEGIEGVNITVVDGTYHIVAEDDGVNANGGNDEMSMPGGGEMMAPPEANENQNVMMTEEKDNINQTKEKTTDDEGILLIKGGSLYVNANGDGLDSNTSIKMTGGTVLVYGPTNNGNGALDYDRTFTIEGGTLVAAGSSGMAQGISEDSSQNALMMSYSEFQKANTAVYVTDEDGKEIIAIAPEKEFQTIVISTPNLKSDQTYRFQTGGSLTGDQVDGLYKEANYKDGSISVQFPLSNVMTYLNEDGVTDGNSNGMVHGNFGQGGMGRKNPFEDTSNSEQSTR